MLRAIVALVLVLAFHTASASAQDNTSGNAWLPRCAPSAERPMGRVDCTTFIYGMHSYNLYATTEHGLRVYCAPITVTIGQLQQIAVKHMKDNPQKLHLPFVDLAIEAYRRAFPCGRNSN